MCDKCEKLRDRKNWYRDENKRLREKVRNQSEKLKELEVKLNGR